MESCSAFKMLKGVDVVSRTFISGLRELIGMLFHWNKIMTGSGTTVNSSSSAVVMSCYTYAVKVTVETGCISNDLSCVEKVGGTVSCCSQWTFHKYNYNN